MTPEEQQTLRARHKRVLAATTYNLYICEICREADTSNLAWRSIAYPCHVVELLDALEKAQCKHTTSYICRCDKPDCGKRNVPGHDKKYAYCPKCGEKL